MAVCSASFNPALILQWLFLFGWNIKVRLWHAAAKAFPFTILHTMPLSWALGRKGSRFNNSKYESNVQTLWQSAQQSKQMDPLFYLNFWWIPRNVAGWASKSQILLKLRQLRRQHHGKTHNIIAVQVALGFHWQTEKNPRPDQHSVALSEQTSLAQNFDPIVKQTAFYMSWAYYKQE